METKEEATPLRGIFCLKNSQDMERIEETEDCFILDSSDPLDSLDSKTKTKKEDGTPLRSILCLKNSQDMKRVEETEDCFILDFDPFDSFDIKKLCFSSDGDKDLDIIHESGQVACRDYPHPRHLCLNFPFRSTPNNETHCHLCYCCICDKPAPCAQWMSSHCNASADSMEQKSPTLESESFYYSD